MRSALFSLLTPLLLLPAAARPAGFPPRETREVAGWSVHVDGTLLATGNPATERALLLLRRMLEEIIRVVPAPAVARLRQVPLYFSRPYPGRREGAEFHADAGWLRANGRDPAMAGGVEFTNIAIFERELSRMPNFALHELAHAFHHHFLPQGFGHPEVVKAFEHARAGGRYAHVERRHGGGRPNTVERAYALTNPMEYFAECTEAFFSRNDFFPFTREDLRGHDPEMFALLGRLWGPATDANSGCP